MLESCDQLGGLINGTRLGIGVFIGLDLSGFWDL